MKVFAAAVPGAASYKLYFLCQKVRLTIKNTAQ